MDQARSRFILAILCKPEWRNGRRSRLKICRGIPPCRFESDLGHHSKSLGDRMRRMIRVSLAAVALSVTLAPFALADENPAHQPGERAGRAESFVLTPAHNLTADEQAALRSLGVTFEHNLSGGRYLVSIAGDDPSDVAAAPTVASVDPFRPSQKIYRAAYTAAAHRLGGTARLTVRFHDDVTLDEARSAVAAAGGGLVSPFGTRFNEAKEPVVDLPGASPRTPSRD